MAETEARPTIGLLREEEVSAALVQELHKRLVLFGGQILVKAVDDVESQVVASLPDIDAQPETLADTQLIEQLVDHTNNGRELDFPAKMYDDLEQDEEFRIRRGRVQKQHPNQPEQIVSSFRRLALYKLKFFGQVVMAHDKQQSAHDFHDEVA